MYENQEKYELALSDYNKAIELDPKYAYAYNGRGNVYKKQKKRDIIPEVSLAINKTRI
ncbi:tetratricopeptide repeat protein [Crocosphaera sp. XPORK-15E]|uniref:tetratricopeptide repeat protein n=1 Tax=Crocosphaera sp. XPORK-15E TaxID=3110247 RepID=UPI002B205C5F|nr:tetratricopeptide repeat protein [Crocosphaera sp. XPORK-15E]MEA5536090.1 tetratricopeptide repeat protein [Crocosphaera sp. XPORK-15E]